MVCYISQRAWPSLGSYAYHLQYRDIDQIMMRLLSPILSLSSLLVPASALLSGGSDELAARSSNASYVTRSPEDASMTWDKYSWILNGERVLVHSGEVKLACKFMRIIQLTDESAISFMLGGRSTILQGFKVKLSD